MKIGVVGAGVIVQDCLSALETIEDIEIIALWSLYNEVEKANRIMDRYHIKTLYTEYKDMLCDDQIDMVYLGIVNSMHYAFAKEALLAGKNVICEKPFTATVNEALELQKIAKEKSLFLFEAMNTLYLPNYLELKEQLKRLPDIKIVRCNYSQYSQRYDNYLEGVILPVFDPVMAGGALMDINIYNVHFVYDLFGKPDAICYFANKGHNGIDTSGILILKYDSFYVECCGAKDSSSPSEIVIQGKDSYIKLNGSPNICESFDVCVDNCIEHINVNVYEHRLINEFLAFRDMFLNKDFIQCDKYFQNTIGALEIIESARKNASIYFPSDEE